MEQLRDLVVRAASAGTRDERLDAYGLLVERFRDMACGYAYSIVGDFHLAEDAAQEAFTTAFGKLDQLQQPEAFPGWFRRIVWSACGRITRRKTVAAVGLDAAASVPSPADEPGRVAEAIEMRDEVLRAIGQLPQPEREATTLFYINGYSQQEVADFLEVPVTTVKNRLAASRGRLKERMLNMVEETLHRNAPDERFDRKVIDELLARPRPLEIPGHPVRQVWDDFRSCFPDFQVVDFEEVLLRDESLLSPSAIECAAYGFDEARILRTGLSAQLVKYWLESGGQPGGIISAGRTFRKGIARERPSANVFHQAQVLWVKADTTDKTLFDLAATVASRLLPHIPIELGEPLEVGSCVNGRELFATSSGQQLEFGVAGFHADDIIRRSGLDDRYRGICLAVGLGAAP